MKPVLKGYKTKQQNTAKMRLIMLPQTAAEHLKYIWEKNYANKN